MKTNTVRPARITGALRGFATATRHMWLKAFTVTLTASVLVNPAIAGEPFGTQVGTFNGVPAFSNGTVGYVSNTYNNVTDPRDGQSYNVGMKFQCVELVNRLYLLVYRKRIRIAGTDASAYYGSAGARGLAAFANGGTTAPEPGDVLCIGGGTTGEGHVCIIRERRSGSVVTINQNLKCNSDEANYVFPLTVRNGSYKVDTSRLGASYFTQGWLRAASAATFTKARIVSPMDGSTLPSSTATFSWTSAPGTREYSLALGPTPGSSAGWSGSMNTRTTVTFSGLPTDGTQIYLRLGTRFDSGWQYAETSYRTADNRAPNSRATMNSPQSGATLPGSNASFSWTLPRDATEIFFYLGDSGAGANNLWGGSLGTRTGVTFGGLPTDGRSIWVRLWTRTPSGWNFADYNFRAARQ